MNISYIMLALGFILETLGFFSIIFIHKAHTAGKELAKLRWFFVFFSFITVGSVLQTMTLIALLKS